MTTDSTHQVVVIGAGQAGLSISAELTRHGVDHVVLEAKRIGESWRSARWDSFCLVTPNWATRLAGEPYDGNDPDGFMDRDDLVRLFEAYASRRALPVREGVCCLGVRAGVTRRFEVSTTAGMYHADSVVIACGTHQSPKFPPIARPGMHYEGDPAHRWTELHASEYRCPDQLDAGGVLVVGAGQSGSQIAEELNEAGRNVWLATSRVGRLPRSYRGVDSIDWQYRFGFLDRPATALESPQHRFRADPHLSGKNGGHTINLGSLEANGVTLIGRLESRHATGFSIGSDLSANLAFADEFAAKFRRDVDAFVAANPQLEAQLPDNGLAECDDPEASKHPRGAGPDSIDLAARNISSIVWATGFGFDFSWIEFPVFDASGYPEQQDFRTSVAGLHFLGLNYVDTRGSGILYGVGADAHRLVTVLTEHAG